MFLGSLWLAEAQMERVGYVKYIGAFAYSLIVTSDLELLAS